MRLSKEQARATVGARAHVRRVGLRVDEHARRIANRKTS